MSISFCFFSLISPPSFSLPHPPFVLARNDPFGLQRAPSPFPFVSSHNRSSFPPLFSTIFPLVSKRYYKQRATNGGQVHAFSGRRVPISERRTQNYDA